MNTKWGMKIYYQFSAVKPLYDDNGGVIRDAAGVAIPDESTRRLLLDWFPNVVLTSGRNRMGTAGGNLVYCQVGTGEANADPDQTALEQHFADTTTVVAPKSTTGITFSAPYYGWKRTTYQFVQGKQRRT